MGNDYASIAGVLSRLERATEDAAFRVIGHSRMAPDQSWKQKRNVQPLLYSFGAVAHNGNIENYRDFARRFDVALDTDVDSEILGRLIDVGVSMNLPDAFSKVDRGARTAILAIQGDSILAFRRGHPLSVDRRLEGLYFLSDVNYGESLKEDVWHSFTL